MPTANQRRGQLQSHQNCRPKIEQRPLQSARNRQQRKHMMEMEPFGCMRATLRALHIFPPDAIHEVLWFITKRIVVFKTEAFKFGPS
jgi:hypothetical protein